MARLPRLWMALGLTGLLTTPAPGQEAVIRGKISGTPPERVTIAGQEAPLEEEGGFEIRLPLEEPGYFDLDLGRKLQLYLSPGDELSLTADSSKLLESIRFSGKGSEVNRYLAGLALSIERLNFRRIFFQPEAAFLAETASLEEGFQSELVSFLALYPHFESEFGRLQRESIRYGWADLRLRYSGLSRRLTSRPDPQTGDPFEKYLGTLDFNDASLLGLPEYVRFLESFINRKAETELAHSSDDEPRDQRLTRARYRVAAETFSDPRVRDFFLSRIMRWQIVDYGVRGIADLMERFRLECSDPELRFQIERLYREEQARFDEVRVEVYHEVAGLKLELYVFQPEGRLTQRPAIVFFHGGGWTMGRPEWAFPQCRYFASRGMVAVAVQYRLGERQGFTPLEAMEDARKAVQWLRSNARKLGIDSHRIAAAGWSAGGHLAAAAALISGQAQEDQWSSRPDALLLWYPAVSLVGDSWFARQLAGKAQTADVSPDYHVKEGAPPAIIFQGDRDRVVRLPPVRSFCEKLKAAGNRCELVVYEGRGHIFTGNLDDYVDTIRRADEFLASLGYLKGEPDLGAIRKLHIRFPSDPERWGL